ncbi:MAG: DUF4845 domain-containing protein [Pyrinomonadaceae bacterium]|nr:DUF4845 domain-containing protein [Pyrinomonadaceae bacterium]
MQRAKRQRGLTITGFLFVAAVVIVAALVSFRMIPAYIEYYSVKKALEGALTDARDLSPAEIRRSVERRLNVDYVDSVRASDVEVTKTGNMLMATTAWEKRLHLVGNVSIILEFEATASR